MPVVRERLTDEYLLHLVQRREASQGPRTPALRGFLETDSLFVHVPKAAGISILQALYGNIGLGHMHIRDFKRVFRKRFIDRAFTFTFVRNPWDRVYSAYNFFKAGGWPEYDAEYIAEHIAPCGSFEEFVIDRLPDEGVRSVVHFRPATELMKQEDGTLFDFAFVGRYERLAQDFRHAARHVRPSARLAHHNRTERADPASYRQAYTPRMIDRVGEHFAESIGTFGYTFDDYFDDVPFMQNRTGGAN